MGNALQFTDCGTYFLNRINLNLKVVLFNPAFGTTVCQQSRRYELIVYSSTEIDRPSNIILYMQQMLHF